MHVFKTLALAVSVVTIALLYGCTKTEEPESTSTNDVSPSGDVHMHDAGSTHADHDDADGDDVAKNGGGHAHDEVSLGSITIDDMEVELAQGHGAVEAGKEGHLVVKLPYSDSGATTIRAWIGGEDRTMSMVGLGTYAPSHDDYDVHAIAPNPLPVDAQWWIEIEKPEGTKSVGSTPVRTDLEG